MTTCTDCPKRQLCKSLCPKAERYVNQDNISRRETPLKYIKGGMRESDETGWGETVKTKRQIIIEMYFVDKLDRATIREKTYYGQEYINRTIREALVKIGL